MTNSSSVNSAHIATIACIHQYSTRSNRRHASSAWTRYSPVAPVTSVVMRACDAKRRSTDSKKAIRSCGERMRVAAGSNTAVTKATPPIHSTTPSTCSTRAAIIASIRCVSPLASPLESLEAGGARGHDPRQFG
jgi:hypothetical protein